MIELIFVNKLKERKAANNLAFSYFKQDSEYY